MSGEWVDDRIEAFRSQLPPDDKRRFDELLETAIDQRSRSEIYDELERHYQRSESHLELVAATASGFHQTPLADGYDSGYEFAFTEPLEELNSEVVGDDHVKNGDLLLVKEDGNELYLCVIECKSGSNAGREWTKELKQIETVFEEYRETVKSQLDAEAMTIKDTQYVLVGRITQLVAMEYDRVTETMDVEDNYAFWGYDRGDRTLVHMHGQVKDKALEREISESIDTSKVENPIDFTFSDHPLTQLKVLIQNLITDNQQAGAEYPFEFDRADFRHKFDSELQVGFSGDVRKALVDERVESLLDLGEKIEIFVTDPDQVQSSKEYRILFRGKKATVAKDKADAKYFETKAGEKLKERAFEDVKTRFDRSQSRLNEGDLWNTEDQSGE